MGASLAGNYSMKQPSRNRMVGRSRRTVLLREELSRAAAQTGGVLLRGEVGAGKELGARTLHRESERRRGPFRMVDCARFFPEDLTAILFGTEERPGTALLRRADRGTLYLVHPEEAVLSIQERLAEFVQTRRFVVGRQGPIQRADVRVIAGTEKDLVCYVRGGLFLRDFWHVLGGAAIEVPPLRERPDDIAAIIEHLSGAPFDARFDARVLPVLKEYPWPGNYDELIEEVERLLRTGYQRIELAHVRRDIVSFESCPASADPEILQVVQEIEQCIQAFEVTDEADLDFAPYFWHGGPVPENAPEEPVWEPDPWEKDAAW